MIPGNIYDVVITGDTSGTQLYINGVLEGSTSAVLYDSITLERMGHAYYTNWMEGDIYGVKLYNTKVSADEVKGLYSGASVPFKYKGASQTELVTNGTFAAGSTGWTSGAGWDTSTGVAVATAAEGNLVQYNVFTLGKSYRLTFDFTYTSGSLHVWAGSNQNIVASLTGNGTKTYEFVCRDVTASARLLFEDSAFTGSIDNVSVVQIGAVAEYDGSSATTGTWYDKSGNGLDGTVTGATLENKGKALEVDGQLIKMHNTASGNALLHIHNDKTSDAAVLRLEGGRTADNDTGQILFANSDNLIAAIKTFRKSADDAGELRFYTSAGGAGIQQRAVILKSGYFGIGTTNPASQLTVGGNAITTVKPTLSVSDLSNGGSITIRGLSPVLSFDKTGASAIPTILTDGGGLSVKSGELDAHGTEIFKIESSGYTKTYSGHVIGISGGNGTLTEVVAKFNCGTYGSKYLHLVLPDRYKAITGQYNMYSITVEGYGLQATVGAFNSNLSGYSTGANISSLSSWNAGTNLSPTAYKSTVSGGTYEDRTIVRFYFADAYYCSGKVKAIETGNGDVIYPGEITVVWSSNANI
jgi:hypothetical protein